MQLIVYVNDTDYEYLMRSKRNLFGNADVIRDGIPLPFESGEMIDTRYLEKEVYTCDSVDILDWEDIEKLPKIKY